MTDRPEGNDLKTHVDHQRITEITLDEETLVHTNADIEHERKIAMFDLIEDNYFSPLNASEGPYHLHLRIFEKRLVLDVRAEDEMPLVSIMLSLSPFRRIVKDYFLMCEGYFQAIRTATPSKIEAIDMGRRGLHNEGSDLLIERLAGKIDLDFNTSRRLFTLLCALHFKG